MFKIGDLVLIKYDRSTYSEMWNEQVGVVTEVLYGEKMKKTYYIVQLRGKTSDLGLWEEELTKIGEVTDLEKELYNIS